MLTFKPVCDNIKSSKRGTQNKHKRKGDKKMKVYIVVDNNEVKLVTTNKERAEKLTKEINRGYNMNGDYRTAYTYEREVEED